MFDLLVALVLLISAGVGFIRGATRELVAVVSLIVAVAVAILGLRLTAPIAMGVIETAWLAKALAMLVTFLVVYIALRLAGGHLSRKVHQTALSSIDRAIGLGFGLIRGLIVVGLFNLVFHAATPPERTPAWVSEARLYPLTAIAADGLRALAPQGSLLAKSVGPAIERAVEGSGEAPPARGGDKSGQGGYDPATLKKLDDLVEKSL